MGNHEITCYPDRLNAARCIKRLSIEQLEELTGIGHAELAMFESGMLQPSRQQMDKLTLVLGFPLAWFSKPPIDTFPPLKKTSLNVH